MQILGMQILGMHILGKHIAIHGSKQRRPPIIACEFESDKVTNCGVCCRSLMTRVDIRVLLNMIRFLLFYNNYCLQILTGTLLI